MTLFKRPFSAPGLVAPKLAALALAAAFSTSSGLAQDAPPPPRDRDTIVVTGENEPVTIRQVQRQARDVAVRTGNVYESPLARFEGRLCPGVIGLDEEMAGMIIDRIREHARTLDIRVREDGCDANFILAFVDDGEAMFRRMMDDSPWNFQYLNSGQKRDILEPGPVHVWTNIEPQTLTGMPIAQSRELMNPPTMQVAGAHTRIYTTTRMDIRSVMISFDRAAVVGLNLGQLADYATMRGLAQTRPAGDLSIDSILTLFELSQDNPEWAPPQRLTEFDTAYLRSLYAEIPNLPAFRKLARVGFELRDLAEGEEEVSE